MCNYAETVREVKQNIDEAGNITPQQAALDLYVMTAWVREELKAKHPSLDKKGRIAKLAQDISEA